MNASEISEDKVGLRKKRLLETKLATSALDRADSAQNPDLFTSSTQPTESNLASLCFALSLDQPSGDYAKVAEVLDLEASLRLVGHQSSPKLQQAWAEVGQRTMDPDSSLYQDLLADIEVADIPLDPRWIERYI